LLADCGLACLVYWYPDVPLRADAFGAGEFQYLAAYKSVPPDIEVSIEGWMQLFVRLLWLG
jgi:hypothetical protein